MSEPTQDYLVTLPMRLEAETPQDAIEQFIEQVNTFGLRAWSFSVQHEGHLALVINGRGEVIEDGDEEGEDGEAGDVPTPDEGD